MRTYMRVPRNRLSGSALITNAYGPEVNKVRAHLNHYDGDRSSLLGIELLTVGMMTTGRQYNNLYILPLVPFGGDDEAQRTLNWFIMMSTSLYPGGKLHWINPYDYQWFHELCEENKNANKKAAQVPGASGGNASSTSR